MSPRVSRRSFVGTALGAVAGGGLLAACTDDDSAAGGARTDDPFAAAAAIGELPRIDWTLATSWPRSRTVVHGAAEYFADLVGRLTGGRLQINAVPAGEIVPAREVFENVGSGKLALGFTESAYASGLDPITQLATGLPFGMNARQHWSWLHDGGGLDLLQPIFRDRFGLVYLPSGNIGCQMGGWSNTEITSRADIEGLRIRIRGLGAAVLAELGASVELIGQDEIVASLQAGTIDAAAGVGPHDDVEQGIDQAALFYYYPGWWAPGPSVDLLVHAERHDRLPEEYRAALEAASAATYSQMLARYDTLNPRALLAIRESDVAVLPFSDDVLEAASAEVDKILDAEAAADPAYEVVLASYRAYRDAVVPWHGVAEKAMLDHLIG